MTMNSVDARTATVERHIDCSRGDTHSAYSRESNEQIIRLSCNVRHRHCDGLHRRFELVHNNNCRCRSGARHVAGDSAVSRRWRSTGGICALQRGSLGGSVLVTLTSAVKSCPDGTPNPSEVMGVAAGTPSGASCTLAAGNVPFLMQATQIRPCQERRARACTA